MAGNGTTPPATPPGGDRLTASGRERHNPTSNPTRRGSTNRIYPKGLSGGPDPRAGRASDRRKGRGPDPPTTSADAANASPN